MSALENRVPPLVVLLVACLIGWAMSDIGPVWRGSAIVRYSASLVIAAVGLVIAGSAVLTFRAARTTVDPLAIERASGLVTEGPFGLTRNPMYLGMALWATAFVVALGSAAAFVAPLVFILYITRFQIIPEERVLERIFGAEYAAFRTRVRRWL